MINWKRNVFRVNKEMIRVNMQMQSLVREKEVTIFWNAMDRQFRFRRYTVKQKNSVERKNDVFIELKFVSAILALINENHPFREWISNRLMPYVDYFAVPLDKKNTGNSIYLAYSLRNIL